MKKPFIPILLLLLVFSAVTIHSKINSEKDNENLVVIEHTEVFGKLEYGKVLFKHQRHVEAMAKIRGLTEEKVCIECHRYSHGDFSFSFVEISNSKNSDEIKNSYHSQCLRCHQELSAKKLKTGPEILSCRECHRKENLIVSLKYPIYEFDFAIHDQHINKLGRDCSICHHTYDLDEKNRELALVYESGTEQSCSYCHDHSKKRGPELRKINEITKKSGLNIQRASHQLCLNCHIKNKIESKYRSPIRCAECHNGKYRTLEELTDIPRPDVGQPKTAFIFSEEAKMKGVPFKHEFHEKNTKTCIGCHHDTLKPCSSCHDLRGNEAGGFVNLITAYHSLNSKLSCQGCHRSMVENNRECMGCHYFTTPLKTEVGKGLMCQKCHRGRELREEDSTGSRERISQLTVSKIPEEVLIKHLEREFAPVNMPHGIIVRKLNEMSSQSRIATYFHGNLSTICRGCHHKSDDSSQSNLAKPPLCVNCHNVNLSSTDRTRPRLEAAYHGMCIRCHEILKIDRPKKCTDCHERKVMRYVHN